MQVVGDNGGLPAHLPIVRVYLDYAMEETMIDIEKQRAECARMEAMLAEFDDGYEFRTTKEHVDFVKIARADWPALIKAHLEACDETDRLRQVNATYLESHLSGMDLAQQREQEIERLRADVAARMPDPVPANDPELHELYDVWKGQR